MEFDPKTIESCPLESVSSYIDGELSAVEISAFEDHVENCATCHSELNSQKKMLSALDYALGNQLQDVDYKDFTKVIVANAESNVGGLRSKLDYARAFGLIFILGIVCFGLSSLGGYSNILGEAGRQFFVIASATSRFILDFAMGTAIILRHFSNRIFLNQTIQLVLSLTAILLCFILIPRLIGKLKRS